MRIRINKRVIFGNPPGYGYDVEELTPDGRVPVCGEGPITQKIGDYAREKGETEIELCGGEKAVPLWLIESKLNLLGGIKAVIV